MSNATGGLSRRTLTKGAAWSVPAIAVAGAAPAYASSPPEEVVIIDFVDGSARKMPGNKCAPIRKGYAIDLMLTNNGNVPTTLTLKSVVGQVEGEDKTFNIQGFAVDGALVREITLQPGESITVTLGFSDATNSPGRQLDGIVTIDVDGEEREIPFSGYATDPVC